MEGKSSLNDQVEGNLHPKDKKNIDWFKEQYSSVGSEGIIGGAISSGVKVMVGSETLSENNSSIRLHHQGENNRMMITANISVGLGVKVGLDTLEASVRCGLLVNNGGSMMLLYPRLTEEGKLDPVNSWVSVVPIETVNNLKRIAGWKE